MARPLADRIRERLHGNSSEAYLWLRLAHRRLRKRMAVKYPPYDEVAAEMAAAGITGGRGASLTGQAVRRFWGRVLKDIADEAAQRPTKFKPPSAQWTPQPSNASPDGGDQKCSLPPIAESIRATPADNTQAATRSAEG